MKKLALVVLMFIVVSCSGYNNKRGVGDAGVGTQNREKPEVMVFSDKYPNVEHKCDGHGHRVYVTTTHNIRPQIVDDPTCPGGPGR